MPTHTQSLHPTHLATLSQVTCEHRLSAEWLGCQNGHASGHDAVGSWLARSTSPVLFVALSAERGRIAELLARVHDAAEAAHARQLRLRDQRPGVDALRHLAMIRFVAQRARVQPAADGAGPSARGLQQ